LIQQASENVRSALQEAQRRADEIVRDAEAEAQRIRAEAEADARRRLDRVRHALEQLETGLGEREQPASSSWPHEAKAVKNAPETSPSPSPAAAEADSSRTPPSPARDVAAAPEPETPAAAPAKRAGDDGGAARLVAMKLALDGTPREEAREQLAADYDVSDLDSLLDQVYAKAGK
jgi:translation initiation factor IF-2